MRPHNFYITLALLLCCGLAAAEIPRRPEPLVTRVAKLERNTVYTGEGAKHLEQIIADDPQEIVAWRIVNRTLTTRRDHGGWLTTWVDQDGTLQAVWSREFEEVHNQYDRELLERNTLPECQRRGLIKPNVRKSTK